MMKFRKVGELLPCLCVVATSITFDVTNFGAIGDGVTDNTHAFEAAIDEVSRRSFGQVLVPSPGVYMVRPINLTSNLEMYIQGGASIAGIPDATKWPIIPGAPNYGQGRDHGAFSTRYTSLIHGEHLRNVTIKGDGNSSVLDGKGSYWWALHESGQMRSTRGHLIEFMYTQNIRIYDITMKDSPFWNNHFLDCEGVHVRGITIQASDQSPNTDGWDPDSSRNVVIEDSTYHGGDDCVAIKAGWDCFGVNYGKPSVNITVRNLTCHGRAAGIAIGSEMSGGVENVLVENIKYTKANGAAHIKTGPSRGGYVKNVVFKDLFIEGSVDDAILVDAFYKAPNPSCPQHWSPPASLMSNYSFVNIYGRNADVRQNTFHLKGNPDRSVKGMYFENVRFSSGREKPDWLCANVAGIAKEGTVKPWPPCAEITLESKSLIL